MRYPVFYFLLTPKIFTTIELQIDTTSGKEPGSQILPTIEVLAPPVYSQHHPLIEKFVEAGFPLEDSIIAVKDNNGNEEAALNHLLASKNSDSLFSDVHSSLDITESISSKHYR